MVEEIINSVDTAAWQEDRRWWDKIELCEKIYEKIKNKINWKKLLEKVHLLKHVWSHFRIKNVTSMITIPVIKIS
jgi:hypothetical protein